MRGYCQSGDKMHIARAKLHYWEEPPISGTRGSGTIFFTGCSLRCAFCQNSEISGESLHGKDFTVEEFIETIKKIEAMGAHNINLVTPTHFASQIAEALRIYKPRVPVVYNCGGYESVEILRMLEGLVDIYLPDFKYADDDLAVRLSNAPHYCETALAAIHEMVRQTGENVYDENGMLQKGVRLAIIGRLNQNVWEKDGQRRSKLEVIVDNVETMTAQRQQQQGYQSAEPQQQYQAAPQPAAYPDVYDEDIPF